MIIQKITSIYKSIAVSINKMDKLGYDRPSLIYPLDVKELISGFTVRGGFMKLLNNGFLTANKNSKLSYEKGDLVVFGFDRGFFAIDEILDEMINFCCQVSSNVTLLYNDYEKNLNPYSVKKTVFKKEVVSQVYKDIIQALHTIELKTLKKSLIDIDSMLHAVQKVEPDIDLLLEGIAIVKRQRKFTYYDIVLIMTRFHCGLTRLLYVIRDIQDAIDTLDRAIEAEKESKQAKENFNHIGVQK